MKPVEIPFNGPAYESISAFMANQICRNFYLRPYPEVGGEKYALFGTPGTTLWADTGLPFEVRGSLRYGDYLYVVVASSFLRYDSDKVQTVLGTLNTGSGPVGMATNGSDLIVVDGADGWTWDYGTTTYAQIVDADFPTCKDVVVIDGYYLVPEVETGLVWRSDYQDGTSWGGLAFSTAGADPDNIRAIIVSSNDVFTIGEETTEIWVNTGAATFNFESVRGATIQKGGAGVFARAFINNAIYWISRDKHGQGQMVQCIGRVPKVVSTPAITQTIQSWGTVSDIQMWAYEQLGHSFIVVTSPSAEETLVYDSSMAQWHSRSSKRFGRDNRWRTNCHAFFDGKHLVGDFYDGSIYEIDPDVYADSGEEIISVRRTSVFREDQIRTTINALQVICEPGVGLVTGEPQDMDPHMRFRFSRDGGLTWIAGDDIPMGKIGETLNRARVTQLGQGRNWVFEITISARVKKVILGAIAEVEIND
jgi:hypothetical protein